MTSVTKSNKNNISSPTGNSLAVFVDAIDDRLKLKDINGKVQEASDYWNKSLGKYGSFYDTTTQTALGDNVPTAMKFNTDDLVNGVLITNQDEIRVEELGIYNIQFSAQIDRVSGSGLATVDIWFRKNGEDIPNSNTKVTVTGNSNQAHIVASWNFITEIGINDYVQIIWNSSTVNVKLVSESENLIIPYPAIPSVILTVIKI